MAGVFIRSQMYTFMNATKDMICNTVFFSIFLGFTTEQSGITCEY